MRQIEISVGLVQQECKERIMEFFKKSLKGLIDIAVTPIEVVKDIATLGGVVSVDTPTAKASEILGLRIS